MEYLFKLFFCIFILLHTVASYVSCQTINNTRNLLDDLFVNRGYRTDVRPVDNQTEIITVRIFVQATLYSRTSMARTPLGL